MLDLETFGNGKHAAICQVGACYFDRQTGEIFDTFKVNVDARSAERTGARLDADTVYWWLSQSREAIESVTLEPLLRIENAMIDLNKFLSKADCIWSHATFDFVILVETLSRLRISREFHHRTARDIRTLMDLSGVSPKKNERLGIHHDALDDCRFQVQYCVEALRILTK